MVRYESAFSPDYATARARFRSSALALGWALDALPIGQNGPDGEALTIEVARLGTGEPRRAVVVSSGLHGVEGFMGSAVQAALLEEHLGGFAPPEGTALILLHALNPYGFAWTRRVNEHNVDLNRNFLLAGEPFTGSPPGYDALDEMLNPRRPPRWGSWFLPRAALKIVQHGMPALKNAVAGGQYDHPHGLFFGGTRPSITQQLLAANLPRWVGRAERVLHVDFHTGLGRRGTYKLLVDHARGSEGAASLARLFGDDVVEPWEPKEGVSYAIRGGLGTWCKERFPGGGYDVLAAEFGTVPILQVISALHFENRAHHWGEPTSPSTLAAKRALEKVFAPPEAEWRDTVVRRGIRVVQTAIEAVLAR